MINYSTKHALYKIDHNINQPLLSQIQLQKGKKMKTNPFEPFSHIKQTNKKVQLGQKQPHVGPRALAVLPTAAAQNFEVKLKS